MLLKELIEKIEKDPSSKQKLVESYLDDFIPNQLLKSETLQQAFGVTYRQMEIFYAQGFAHYQNRELWKAEETFRWLVTLNPLEKKYWMGFAASLQLLGRFEKALKGYALAAFLDADDPTPHIHAEECYLALGNAVEAAHAKKDAAARQKTLAAKA